MNKKALFWFRRDLRVEDNTGLYRAARESHEVLPFFIFDKAILRGLAPDNPRLYFLRSALRALDRGLREKGSGLFALSGDAYECVRRLIEVERADALYLGRALSPGGAERDGRLKAFCREKGVLYREFEDALLVFPHRVPARRVFTPFYRLWRGVEKAEEAPPIARIASPEVGAMGLSAVEEELGFPQAESSKLEELWPLDYPEDFPERRLREFDFSRYAATRNTPSIDGTSRLSPYLRFGVVSIRRVYHLVSARHRDAHAYISEPAWREFWHHVMHHFPETREEEFQQRRRGIGWLNDEKWYGTWREGRTGYPIVDAGMRQLREEGWMHNRLRMIVASFLTKDLLIDWRLGDRHFYHHLLDYDEAVDIGNWQWAASVGADPKPLRILNPILQSKRYDPEGRYIKKYVPELRGVEPERLHDPLTYDLPYHKPLVNHYEMSRRAREAYARAVK